MHFVGKVGQAPLEDLRLPHAGAKEAIDSPSQKEDMISGSRDMEQLVRATIIAHRRRRGLFSQDLFADPAWDVLLIVTLAECRQQRLAVSKLCTEVDAPITTALRWINTLAEYGVLVRRDDPTDKRRKYVELSDEARERMSEYFLGMGSYSSLAA